MRRLLGPLCLGLALLAGLPAALAESLIVDADELDRLAQRGALVWDARSASDYAAGHIAGAVNIGDAGALFLDRQHQDPPSAAQAARLFGTAGMDILRREVVVYSRQGDPLAYFAARMVEYYGAHHAKVYHGGLDDWRARGRPVSTAATRLAPVALTLTTERAGTLWTQEVIERARSRNAQIVDVRTPGEYTGQDIRASRGGHIAGAINIPYEQNWKDPATPAKLAAGHARDRAGMALKSRQELEALYAGLDRDKETVVYCQSGVRASETAVVLRSLGFGKVKVYEPSWLGYADAPSAPVENEVARAQPPR